MADHNKPTLTSSYSDFVTELKGRVDDVALGLDPATTTPTNVPINAIRWTSASNKWQKWSGTAWTDLSGTYAINISGSAAKLTTARTISLQGGATGTATSFNGSTNVSIPVTALDPTKITGTVPINKGGTGAANAVDARANLGLGGAATLSVGTTSGTVAAGNDSRISGAAQKSANLSDLTDVTAALSNLGIMQTFVRKVETDTKANELIFTSANTVRYARDGTAAGYGAFWRNDATMLYLMLTNNNDALGTFNTLRPFTVNKANGAVSIETTFTSKAGVNLNTAILQSDGNIQSGIFSTGALHSELAKKVESAEGAKRIHWNGSNFHLNQDGSGWHQIYTNQNLLFTWGSINTYALMMNIGSTLRGPNDTESATYLRSVGIFVKSGTSLVVGYTEAAVSGTWRCLGPAANNSIGATLWVRIA